MWGASKGGDALKRPDNFPREAEALARWAAEQAGGPPANAERVQRLWSAPPEQRFELAPLRGQARVRRPGQRHFLPTSEAMEIQPGAEIELPAGARAFLRCPDGSRLLLESGSRVTLEGAGPRLEAGRFYAWVAKPRGGQRFRALVDADAIAGTGGAAEFELRRGDAGAEGFRWKLLAQRGKAVFIPRGLGEGGASAVGASSEQTLQAGEALTCSASGTSVSNMGMKMIASETAWARSAGRMASLAAMQTTLSAAVALGLIVAATAALRPSWTDKSPLAMAPSPADRWNIGVWLGCQRNDGYIWGRELIGACQAASASADGSRSVSARFEHAWLLHTITADSCPPISLPAEAFERFAEGVALRFDMTLAGDVRAMESASINKPDEPAVALLELALREMASVWMPRRAIAPGDRWTEQREMPLSLQPSALAAWTANFHFVGYEPSASGARQARIAFRRKWNIENLNCSAGADSFTIESLRLIEQGNFYADAATGRPIKVDSALSVAAYAGTDWLSTPKRYILFWEY
jgi:hypothetical protein